jgi:hypothetical protein
VAQTPPVTIEHPSCVVVGASARLNASASGGPLQGSFALNGPTQNFTVAKKLRRA